MIIKADALDMPLGNQSVDCVITSPPYYGLRKYGDSMFEVGTEESLDEYIDSIIATSYEIWRVLKDDGIFWLNLGDTASGSGGAGGDYNKGGNKAGRRKYRQGNTGVAKGSWCLVPHRVAIELSKTGWLVRSQIVWDKDRVRPEDSKHVRRPLLQHEYVFMLTKSMRYRYEPKFNISDIWTIKSGGSAKGAPAPFPDELVIRCLLLSTKPGDIVLDPFVGSGTTVRVAERLNRIGIGLDLYGGKWLPEKSQH